MFQLFSPKKLVSVALCVLLSLACVPTVGLAQAAPARHASLAQVVSADLLASMEADPNALQDAMVLFKEQASLQEAAVMVASEGLAPTSEEVRKEVVGDLQDTALRVQEAYAAWLDEEIEAGNAESYEQFYVVNGMHVVANAQVIELFAESGDVESITANSTVSQVDPIAESGASVQNLEADASEVEWNIAKVGADKVWSEYGVTGKGVVVGILDTAVDVQNPALKTKFLGYDSQTGQVSYEGFYQDCVGNTTNPDQAQNVMHGTHVAGTILGSETETSDDGQTQTINAVGMAPDAKFVAARVFDDAGASTDDALIRGAQWMLAPGGNVRNAPSIVNNSWGSSDGSNGWYQQYVCAWRAAGILPVFAAGNQISGEPAPGPGSISSPGSYEECFTVAAVDANNQLASFSKRGPSPVISDASVIKPEISAPGVGIRSAGRGGYLYLSGTSMATPLVVGAAALLKSADNSLASYDIQHILETTATELTDAEYPESPNMGYGYGCVDAYDAVSVALGSSVATLTGTVTCEGVPVEASVAVRETGQAASADAATGAFTLKHAAGTYTLTCNAYGYEPFERTVTLSADAPNSLDIQLVKKARGTLRATVKDTAGAPVAGAHIRLLNSPDANVYESGADGSFTLESLPEGTYTLRVYKNSYEGKDVEVGVSAGQSDVDIVLQPELERVSSTQAHDNGRMAGNLVIGQGGYAGCAVCFVPLKANSIVASATIALPSSSYLYAGTQAKLTVLEKDKRGRTSVLAGPVDITLEPGAEQTIDLREYQIKTSNPYYLALTIPSSEATPFQVGIDPSGDGSFSYVYSGNNLSPLSNEDIDGALMIRSTMEYPADAQDLYFPVATPSVKPVSPSERVVRGTADANQLLMFVVGSKRIQGRADAQGNFEKILPAELALTPGMQITCYGKDANGLLSDPAYTVVTTSRANMNASLSAANQLLEKDALTPEQRADLEGILGAAQQLLDEVDAYEAGSDLASEQVVSYQDDIDAMSVRVRKALQTYSALKVQLLDAIERAQEDYDWTLTSKDGSDVPVSRFWATSSAKFKFNNKISAARATYDRILASDEEVSDALAKLESAQEAFRAARKQGLKEGVAADDAALKPLVDAIASAKQRKAAVALAENGNQVASDQQWATAQTHAAFQEAIDAAERFAAEALEPSGLAPTASEIEGALSALRAAQDAFEQNVSLGASLDQEGLGAFDAALYNAKALLYSSRQLSSRFTDAVSSARTDFIQAIDQAVSWRSGAHLSQEGLQAQLDALTQATSDYQAVVDKGVN